MLDAPAAALLLGQAHVVGALGDDPGDAEAKPVGELRLGDARILDRIVAQGGDDQVVVGTVGRAGDQSATSTRWLT